MRCRDRHSRSASSRPSNSRPATVIPSLPVARSWRKPPIARKNARSSYAFHEDGVRVRYSRRNRARAEESRSTQAKSTRIAELATTSEAPRIQSCALHTMRNSMPWVRRMIFEGSAAAHPPIDVARCLRARSLGQQERRKPPSGPRRDRRKEAWFLRGTTGKVGKFC